MENKLNREGIKNYSSRFAEKALSKFFESNEKITGEQLLEVQPIRQINLFVIKNLFREWQKETVRLKSPYFDYSNVEVSDALTNFMNILSRNISISKDAFYDLFIQAVEETILLIFSPYDFYIHIVERNDESLSRTNLDHIAKYVKINKNIISLLLDQMQAKDVEELNGSNLPELMDDVFAKINEGPEDIENYLKEFTEAVPLQVNDLYLDEDPQDQIHFVNEDPEKSNSIEEDGPTEPIQDNFEQSVDTQKTLHDELSDTSKTTIAEIHEKKKVESLRDSLSINQRFMFINMLFDGNDEAFSGVLDDLEELDKFYDATGYLKENFPNWDYDSEEVMEFLEVIEKRY
ncbi:MAG: hypothetical protein AAF693_20565 [Bacteroidota bacterium]